MAGRAFTEILARLESCGLKPKSIGPRRIEAFCPVHDDRRRPNLNLTDHTPGKATVHCWACGDGSGQWLKQFMDALGLLPHHVYDDAWSNELKPKPRQDPGVIDDLDWSDELPRHPWIESAAEVYLYRRVLDGPIVGVYLVWKGRKKKRAHVRPSRFGLVAGLAGGLYSWDHGQRVWRRTGQRPGMTFPTTRLPFYRGEYVLPKLDELTDPILWCAGQKDADTAARLGFPSVAHPGGEGACRPDLARQLAGRRVVILFDYDATGRKMGPRLADRLRAYGVEARALDPTWMVRDVPGPVPEGFDLSDWSEAVSPRGGLAFKGNALLSCPGSLPEGPPSRLGNPRKVILSTL